MIEVQKSGFTVSAQGEGIQYARGGEICNALAKGFGPFLERGRVLILLSQCGPCQCIITLFEVHWQY